MSAGSTVAIVILCGLLLANIASSIAVARAPYFSMRQKVAQCLLVWIVPVVGAITVGVFLYSQRDNTTFDSRAFPERSEKAVGLPPSEG